MQITIPLQAALAAAFALAMLLLALSPARAEPAGMPTDEVCERHIAEAEKALDI